MATDLSHPADYWSQVARLRHFWWSLVTNDLKNRYRHSFLGTAWSLGKPVGMTMVLCVVFSKAFNVSARDYIPFLFLSIALWQFLVESMIGGCNSFRNSASYIRQQPVPLVIFPLRTVLGTSIHSIAALVLGIVFVCIFKGPPSPLHMLSVLPGILLVFLVGFSLATLLGIVHTHFTDTQHLMEILLQALFYLTPVMYRAEFFAGRGRMTNLINLNPFTALLEVVRRPLLDGKYPDPHQVMQAACFALALMVLAWWGLRRVEKTLVYWV